MLDPRTHFDRRNPLEELLRWIPGFRGYLEKQYRRESDAMVRQAVATRLERSKRDLETLSRKLADARSWDQLPLVDRLRNRLEMLIARIRGAMPGYSGVFDAVRIDEVALDRLLAHDLTLVEQVDQVAQQIADLPTRQDPLVPEVEQIHRGLDLLEEHCDQREDLLKGLI